MADAASFAGPPLGLLAVRTGTRWGLPGPRREAEQGREHAAPWVPLALAAAEAWRQAESVADAEAREARELVDRVRAAAASVRDVEVVGDPDDRLPHVVTFCVLYADGEVLLEELARRGLSVASGVGLHVERPASPATCSRRWGCSPTATCGSPCPSRRSPPAVPTTSTGFVPRAARRRRRRAPPARDGRPVNGGPPVVDARGTRCPLPVIRLARAARDLPARDDVWCCSPTTSPPGPTCRPGARMQGHTVSLHEDEDWTEYRVVLGAPRTERGQADSST